MSGSGDKRGSRGGFSLPLPPPDEEFTSRARVSTDVPAVTRADLPFLPSDEDDDAVTGYEVYEDDDPFDVSIPGERTVVDDGIAPGFEATAHLDQLPTSPVERMSPRDLDLDAPPRRRLPLPGTSTNPTPPPQRSPAPPRRATLPGTARHPGNKPQPRITPNPGTRGGDPATAVASDMLAALDTPLVGERYRIVERIGEGGMGKVYKVTHAQLGKTFALKIISDNLARDAKHRDQFYREARMASSLSHPNIASVVDFGEDGKLGAFMVMEFVMGKPLSKVLRKEGKLGVKLACDIILQVAEALHYIHNNKIVHCDIKTENILLCEVSGTKRRTIQVKLLDFGLARSLAGARNTSSLSGTPHYVAPERIRGAPATPSADIYGTGILFYELLTGRVPWDGHVAAILRGHLEVPPTPPSTLIEGGLDPALETLVLRALAKTPEERHKDMAAFIYELRTVMDMMGINRRNKRGSRSRILIERNSENKRDELARAVFDSCRFPMALLDEAGMIALANAAFARFVMGAEVDVEGLPVHSTPLLSAWPMFDADLRRARQGEQVRRVLELDVGEGARRRLLMSLDPGFAEDQVVFACHPLE